MKKIEEMDDPEKTEFVAILATMEYESIEELYVVTENRQHQAWMLQYCARALEAFMNRKDTLTTLAEISQFVREFPIWKKRQVTIETRLEEFKARKNQ